MRKDSMLVAGLAAVVTSLFVVMLVAFAVAAANARKERTEKEACEAKLTKISGLVESTKELESIYLKYDTANNWYVIPIYFEGHGIKIPEGQELDLLNAGRRLSDSFKKAKEENNREYILVIEGQGDGEDGSDVRSYQRATRIRDFWRYKSGFWPKDFGSKLIVTHGALPRSILRIIPKLDESVINEQQ